MDVGADQDGAEVFGVDRLGLPPAADDLLGEGRADREQARAHLRRHDHAFGAADQLVVLDQPGVHRVPLAGLQPDPIPPPDLVDQQDLLALGQDSGHSSLRARIRQCQ